MLRIPFRLLANLWRLVVYLWSASLRALARRGHAKRPTFVTFELESSYPLGAQAPSGWRRFVQEEDTSLLELRESLDALGRAEDIAGVVIKLEGAGMGQSRTQDLIRWLDRLRESGKRIIMQTDSAGQRELLVLSSATDRLLTPAGRISLFGLRFEEIFLFDLLEKLGIKGQFVHIGDYKTATHRFHKRQMTEPQRLMMKGLQQGLSHQLHLRLEDRFGLTPQQVRGAIAQAPLDIHRSRGLGLTTGECFQEHLEPWVSEELAGRADARPQNPAPQDLLSATRAPRALAQPLADVIEKPKDDPSNKEVTDKEKATLEPRFISLDRFLATRPPRSPWRPLLKKSHYLAVLDLTGAIVMGGEGPSPLGAGPTIRPDEVIPKLHALKRDRRCLGVLLHVNSPGGSALASDLMWFEIQSLRAAKPVVCYCSDVAASGGYYLACAADQIVCNESTITGSIGVITGKVALGGALEKLDVHVEAIEEHPNSRFLSPFEPLTQEVMDNLVRDARDFYARFLDRVGQARALPRKRLHRYARGRVYLGDEALQRGLVDRLGGLDEAIEELYRLTHQSAESAPLHFVSHHRQSLRDLARGSLFTAPDLVHQTLGPLLEPAHIAAWLAREPMLALLPWRPTQESAP